MTIYWKETMTEARTPVEALEAEYNAWFISKLESRPIGKPYPDARWAQFVLEVVIPRVTKKERNGMRLLQQPKR